MNNKFLTLGLALGLTLISCDKDNTQLIDQEIAQMEFEADQTTQKNASSSKGNIYAQQQVTELNGAVNAIGLLGEYQGTWPIEFALDRVNANGEAIARGELNTSTQGIVVYVVLPVKTNGISNQLRVAYFTVTTEQGVRTFIPTLDPTLVPVDNGIQPGNQGFLVINDNEYMSAESYDYNTFEQRISLIKY